MSFAAPLLFLLLSPPMVRPQDPPVRPPPRPQSGQTEKSGQSGTRRNPPTEVIEDSNPNAPNTPAKLLKYQHEETMKDIDKLVKLVTEIQDEVDKAGENVLPLNTLKKLEDVERMSRKIRGRIKQ